MNQELLEECVAYFRSRPVYQKLFREMQKKYASLGHLGGKMTLQNLSVEERKQLQGFLKKDFSAEEVTVISYSFLQKALAGSKFGKLSWQEILETYLSEKLVKKQDVKEREKIEREEFFAQVTGCYQDRNSGVREWLQNVAGNPEIEGHSYLMRLYREKREVLQQALFLLGKMAAAFPSAENREESLPVFAAKHMGNPHGLDAGTMHHNLLFYYLKWQYQELSSAGMTKAEYRQMLFLRAGILIDELSNTCLIYGVHAWKKDGKSHIGIEGFCQERQPMVLTLKTVNHLKRIVPEAGVKKSLYVVENPAVFSVLSEKYPEQAFLCGNGQLRLAVLKSLDLLEEETPIYYSGDYDPEGLLIAQRMRNRYGERVHFWKYCAEYYQRYCSEKVIDDSRLQSLQGVVAEELQPVREAMLREKRAVYQEAMMEVYEL